MYSGISLKRGQREHGIALVIIRFNDNEMFLLDDR
jgi:hypothetical protein